MGKFRSVFITALAAFLVTVAIVKPAFGQEKAYTSSWAVQITGGAEKADEIAEKYGFENLGLVKTSIIHSVLVKIISFSDWWTK